MTSILLEIRNIGISKKTFTSLFQQNQNIEIHYNENSATIKSKQNGSTPGIVTKYLSLEPKTTYEMVVLGTTTSDVVLWAYDYTNKELLSDNTVKLGTTSTSAVHIFVTNRHNTKIKVKFGLLFEKPSVMNDTYDVESFVIIKRGGEVIGLWRKFEHGNLLLTDKYSVSESRWLPTVTYVNNS